MGELNRCLDSLESDPHQLISLGRNLEDLVKKMPRDLREGEDNIKPDDPAWVAEMIRQVRPILMQRLLGKGASK